MISQTIDTLCKGQCYVQKIVVSASNIVANRFICRKGENLMDRLFYITKGTFHISEKGQKEICAPEGTLLYLPSDVEYTSYWEQIDNSSYIAFNSIP